MSASKTLEVDFTIGADPEFCCIDKRGYLISSANYNTRNCFGKDGGGVAFEMRPDYSTNPLQVVSNIHKNFLQLVMNEPVFNEFEWRAGSSVKGHAIGGHIHFGNLPKTLEYEQCCNWLDQLVGSCSILIEDKCDGYSRRQEGYGEKSDFRVNSHGFEYRTISSWLTSPYVSAAVLCLSKVVMHELCVNSIRVAPRFVTADDFLSMDVENVRRKFPLIWKRIQGLKLYPEFAPHLEIIPFLINNKRSWFPKHSMKTAWGIMDMSKVRELANPNITLEAIWKNVVKTV